jgi:2,4-dienoyl-CoA reductase-like NADH-dependent reductase (Old Yellow Enzyme family)
MNLVPDGVSTAFPHLFSPLRIGPIQLKNRIVSTGHDTVMAEDGQITDRLIAYHDARARGGARRLHPGLSATGRGAARPGLHGLRAAVSQRA